MQGRLDEQEKLVSIIREVDVVISALAIPQVLEQINILEAIKVAGNIKVFLHINWRNIYDNKISKCYDRDRSTSILNKLRMKDSS